MRNLFLFAILFVLLVGCDSGKPGPAAEYDPYAHTDMEVVMDSVMCDLILPLDGQAMSGGDGAISIDLKGGSSIFMWGDSFFGKVVDGKRTVPAPLIMGNTFSRIYDDSTVKFYYNGSTTTPSSYLQADKVGSYPTWYWPGHGCVRDGVLHLFMSKFIKESEDMMGFRYVDCDLFCLDAGTLQVLDRTNFPAAMSSGIHFGHAVLDDGNFIYVYGTKTEDFTAHLYVARCKSGDQRLTGFEYWDGSAWQDDPVKSAKLEGVTFAVSEQFNVVKLKEKYVLVSQGRLDTQNIYSAVAVNPQGPFGNVKTIYKVNEPELAGVGFMSYNAMVHPQYVRAGKVLMCYNVNTSDFEKHFEMATLYRPRFFWMPIEKMLSTENE